MPYSKRIANKIPEQVQVTLRARGFELLWFSLQQHSSISVDLNGRSSSINKLGIGMAAEFSKQFRQSLTAIEVISAVPDSVSIFLSSKYQKKVPVVVDIDLTIKKNYGLYDKIQIKPDSVYISGEKSIIEKINQITSQPLKFEEIDKSIQTDLVLLSPDKDVLLSDYSASMIIPIDEFIENKLSLNVNYKPQGGRRLLTIPEKVDIIYKVPLRYYNKLPLDSFTIVANADEALSPGKLNVRVTSHPVKATVISVVPSVVNFFIEN